MRQAHSDFSTRVDTLKGANKHLSRMSSPTKSHRLQSQVDQFEDLLAGHFRESNW